MCFEYHTGKGKVGIGNVLQTDDNNVCNADCSLITLIMDLNNACWETLIK